MAVWLVRILDGEDPAPTGISRFDDVSVQEWWSPHVERLADLEVTVGCSLRPARCCPDKSVTRAQMATFLVRAFKLQTDVAPAGFVDTTRSVHAGSIDALAESGITAGCATEPARYCPDKSVTRGQMASLLNRARSMARYTAVTAGPYHACGLQSGGTIVCWGDNSVGQGDPPDGPFDAVAAGPSHTCALRADRTVACWGSNRFGQAAPPEGEFEHLALGWTYSCGVRTDGRILCWGNREEGRTDAPTGRFRSVSAGFSYPCGIRVDGRIVCWGIHPTIL